MSKKNKTVHIVCVLDRSGSMFGRESDVIGGFNTFIADQKKEEGKAKVTLVLFDGQYEIVHDKVKVKKVPDLTKEVYYTRGSTSLFDAIGKTINKIKDKEDGIFLIQTDGEENSSMEFNKDTVQKLVKKMEKKGWDFVFLGADMDAMTAGRGIGMAQTIAYVNNKQGNTRMYASLSTMTTTKRGDVGTGVKGADVMRNLDEDNLDINKSEEAST